MKKSAVVTLSEWWSRAFPLLSFAWGKRWQIASAALALWVFVGWRERSSPSGPVSPDHAPTNYVAKPIPEIRTTPSIPTPVVLPVKDINAKTRKAIERKIDAPLPEGRIVKIDVIDRMPRGGWGIVVLGEDGEEPKLHLYAEQPPFAEFLHESKVRLLAGKGWNESEYIKLEYEQAFFRIGPVKALCRGGLKTSDFVTSPSIGVDAYIECGGEVSLR